MKRPMQKMGILFLILCLGPLPELWGQAPAPTTEGEELSGKDQFQAAEWLRLADGFWETGDYRMLKHFSNLIIERYPNTYYAKEARKLLNASSSPLLNRSREWGRSNPALFPK
ncbi:MAG: hypothetical protein HY542_06915 [Deltaproteobacteria bacterium]|nr:hypothetical protein [Deltaproteobacteria bacterium]